MDASLLFHHYDPSPFSEKIRLVFGRKGLAWRSVLQPNMMPKPHLVPLTGGYRKIPVLQIGADVYCDTQRIVRELEARHPEPPVLPEGSDGLCHMVNFWADRLLFQAAVPVLFHEIADAVPEEFIEDRRRLMGGGDFARVMQAAPLFRDALRAHLDLIESQLRDGRPFLLGPEPCFADFAAYHPVWFLASVPPAAKALEPFSRTLAWAGRVRGVGHGERTECPPEEALAVAREAEPVTTPQADPGDPGGLAPGDAVSVVPDDYGFDPVEGRLVRSDVHEVAIRRRAPEVGEVVVHFPRAGFRVTRA